MRHHTRSLPYKLEASHLVFRAREGCSVSWGRISRNREFCDSQPPDVGETSAGIDGYGTRESTVAELGVGWMLALLGVLAVG